MDAGGVARVRSERSWGARPTRRSGAGDWQTCNPVANSLYWAQRALGATARHRNWLKANEARQDGMGAGQFPRHG
jgi:hypothetical protein